MKIYHGSEFIIEKPEYGKGKPYNDYGKGFYCTENIELAKEWSCDENHDGYANVYELNLDGLKILNLNSDEYTILHWLTILVQNRTFRLSNLLAKDAKDYLIQNFSIDISGYDVIIGYRADDSYFAFAEDFLNNTISVSKLSKAMRLGNLGEQVVLMSENAFSNLTFVETTKADKSKYYVLKTKRDKAARGEYLNGDRIPSYSTDELYVLDLMRQGLNKMIHAYDEMYVDGAMNRMGDMLEFASVDLNMDPDAFFKMFIDSTISRKFEIGDVSIVAGKSGPEIAAMVINEVDHRDIEIKPAWREERSDVFWAGWVMAYFEWYVNKPFHVIWKDITIRKLLKMYPTYHEADISKAILSMERMTQKKERRSISELRILRGWSQAQLASMAGMSVSQLQRLEYGERKTDNMTLKSAIALANALGVNPEVLLSADDS